jgi:BirA family biotin operon repressor/biotin-[acetyl-CoA-carboxylase] ligase
MVCKLVEKDPLWQEILASGHLGEIPVTILDETTSTNEVALNAAKRGDKTHSLFIAETQSMGRGRLGKSWSSPPGTGLYFSMILRPALDPSDLPKITLAAGLAACRGVRKVTGMNPQIKWPNDLLLDGKKFAGILTETESMSEKNLPVVILGIGMNVNTLPEQFPSEIQNKATSLTNVSGQLFSRGELLKEIVDEIIRVISRLEKEGFTGILTEWKEHDATIGRELKWVTQDGKVISGVSLGPDKDGLLRIKDTQGVLYEVLSGDINLVSVMKT